MLHQCLALKISHSAVVCKNRFHVTNSIFDPYEIFLKVALITRTPTLSLFDPYESETRLSHSQGLRYFWSNPRLAVVGGKIV
jgi:hypothetical protein